MDHKRIAESLVRKCGTRDPFRIAKDLGFVVIRCPLVGIRGFCQRLKRRYIIYIDSDLSDWDARFVCAHEIGHIFLHRGENRLFASTHTFFCTSRHETEADRFATDLIFDDDDLRFFLSYPVQLAADHMGVSTQLAEYRMKSIGR